MPRPLATVAEGCEQIAAMPDPIGEITGVRRRPTGISVGQMRVPLGVFGMIYESRPNVTIEAASLAIKSGNACILRGGSRPSTAIWPWLRWWPTASKKPACRVRPCSRAHDRPPPSALDQLAPVGGRHPARWQRADRAHQCRGPRAVIKHLDGNCHTYVDEQVDLAFGAQR